MNAVTCFYCGRPASDISEYRAAAASGDYLSADDAARDDGTYNPSSGRVCCTSCYIAQGMPASPHGWRAP